MTKNRVYSSGRQIVETCLCPLGYVDLDWIRLNGHGVVLTSLKLGWGSVNRDDDLISVAVRRFSSGQISIVSLPVPWEAGRQRSVAESVAYLEFPVVRTDWPHDDLARVMNDPTFHIDFLLVSGVADLCVLQSATGEFDVLVGPQDFLCQAVGGSVSGAWRIWQIELEAFPADYPELPWLQALTEYYRPVMPDTQ